MEEERRILIIANRTAAEPHLQEVVRDRLRDGPCKFTLLVPVGPPPGGWTWTEEEASNEARRRLDDAVAGLTQLGANIEGRLEDGSPMDAVEALMEHLDHVRHQPFDEIILSTLPSGRSRWLKQDLKSRLERHYGLPVTHVVSETAAPAP